MTACSGGMRPTHAFYATCRCRSWRLASTATALHCTHCTVSPVITHLPPLPLSPSDRTLFLRNGRHFWSDSLSELGVYGVCVEARGKGSLMNAAAGHLLRTKTADSNEGGVASGFAVLDSPAMQ